MKLLFDENLSHKLPHLVAASFPESQHVRELGLKGRTDEDIWNFAKSQRLRDHFKGQGFLSTRPALRFAAEIHLAPPRQLHPR